MIMNMKVTTILPITALAGLLFCSSPAHGETILANFDQPDHPRFNFTLPVDRADHDGDGDLEGRIEAEGFKAIAKLQLSRNSASAMLQSTPFLNVELKANRIDSTGNFLIVTVMIQTDIGGKDIYDVVKDLRYSPWNDGGDGFKLDLRTINSKSVPDFMELVSRYEAGEGQFLNIGLIQQTAKDAQAAVVYDTIKLTKD